MVKKYTYELVFNWYITSWDEKCTECGRVSKNLICTSCGMPKTIKDTPVTDMPTLKKLNLMDRTVIEELEEKLREKEKAK